MIQFLLMRTYFFRLASALLITQFAFPEARADGPIVIKWAVAHEPTNIRLQKVMADIAAEVQTKSDGRMKIEPVVYEEDGQNLFYRARDDVYTGEVQISQVSTDVLAQYTPFIRVLGIPFLFHSHEQVARTLDGPVGKTLERKLLQESGKKSARSRLPTAAVSGIYSRRSRSPAPSSSSIYARFFRLTKTRLTSSAAPASSSLSLIALRPPASPAPLPKSMWKCSAVT